MVIISVVGLALTGCGSSSGSGASRSILVDYNHDQFATSIFGYFPQFTEVHPGDRIVFKQAWTGEAHTVTLGTLLKPIDDIVKPYFDGEKPFPEGEPAGLEDEVRKLPDVFGGDSVNQTAAQPCYLKKSGSLPAGGKACPRIEQPAFTGQEPFYSSGLIPYEGNSGNRFTVQLSKSIAPGDYYYYCLIHGAGMAGWLQVKPATTKIASQTDVNKRGSREVATATKDLKTAYNQAKAGKADLPPGDPKIDIQAGAFPPESAKFFGFVDEFFPKTFKAKVGQKVTWFVAAHTVSFDVPKYGPQLSVDKKTHQVKINKKAYDQVGLNIPAFEPKSEEDSPPPFDGGNYDGSKFISTGVQGGLRFSLTFTKAGTYQYACTIHPRMVGTVVVSS
jgi:plastocyanin